MGLQLLPENSSGSREPLRAEQLILVYLDSITANLHDWDYAPENLACLWQEIQL